MKFDDDSEPKGHVYSRVVTGGYGGRHRTEVSIDVDGVLRVQQPNSEDMVRPMTDGELDLVAAVCGSFPVFSLPQTVELPRSRSGSSSTVFSFVGQTVTVNDLGLQTEVLPPAVEILNNLFDTLMNWS